MYVCCCSSIVVVLNYIVLNACTRSKQAGKCWAFVEEFIESYVLWDLESHWCSLQYVSKVKVFWFCAIITFFLCLCANFCLRRRNSVLAKTILLNSIKYLIHELSKQSLCQLLPWISCIILLLALIAKLCGDCVIQSSVWKSISEGALSRKHCLFFL